MPIELIFKCSYLSFMLSAFAVTDDTCKEMRVEGCVIIYCVQQIEESEFYAETDILIS